MQHISTLANSVAVDELLHLPTTDPLWQESCYFAWHDPKNGIAGIHRIGLQVGLRNAVCCCCVMTDDGAQYRYNRHDEVLTHGGAGAALMSAGPQKIELGASPVIRFVTGELNVSLVATDVHPPSRALEAGGGGYQETSLASNHAEGIARFKGVVMIGGRRYEVDALGFRDHSWGPRDWTALLSFRTCIGSTGADLTWSGLVMHIKGKPVMSKGYVERQGRSISASSVDIVCFIEGDGLTHRGGVCRIDLADGSSVLIEAETCKGTILHSPNVYSMEGMCRARIDGQLSEEAFCLLEMSNNAQNGTYAPEFAVRASLAHGLSHRPDLARAAVHPTFATQSQPRKLL